MENKAFEQKQHRRLWLILLSIGAAILILLAAKPIVSLAQDGSPATPDPGVPGPNYLSHNHPLLLAGKHASPYFLAPGEVTTFTIRLENIGGAPIIVKVVDPVPMPLFYVPGSVNEGGVYDPAQKFVAWENVHIPAGEHRLLRFAARYPEVSIAVMPHVVVNIAKVIGPSGPIAQVYAPVVLLPAPVPRPDLSASDKLAARRFLLPDESMAFFIDLVNTGGMDAEVNVRDPLPVELAYIPDSASNGGVYDEASRTITWQGIKVPARSRVRLKFEVKPAIVVEQPMAVVNQAFISMGAITGIATPENSAAMVLIRQAWVVLLPEPDPIDSLFGSHKGASRLFLPPSQTVTFTIHLHNSNLLAVTADVADPLPVELALVPGSVTEGGVYDELSRTIRWTDKTLQPGEELSLSFEAAPAIEVAAKVVVTNTATISAEGGSLQRHARIILVPQPDDADEIPPVVHRLVIDEQDVLNTPQTWIHIKASDNREVRWMFLKEWRLVTFPWPHWREVRATGWIPFNEHIPWILNDKSGVHFVGVWVADQAHNRSRLTRLSLDFASLLLPGEELPAHGLIPYMVYYPQGVEVIARLTTLLGDADLFAWFHNHFWAPNLRTNTPGPGTEMLEFTTPVPGIYHFAVYAFHDTVFNLDITPPGGPFVPWISTHNQPGVLAPEATADDPTLSILAYSGIDPLSSTDPEAPAFEFKIYAPLVKR